MKKIIVNILLMIMLISCNNYVKADVVVTENKISYTTANTVADAEKKYSTYGTVEKTYYNTGAPWNKPITTGYRKFIFKEEINGLDAFCLDPGKGIDSSYNLVNDNDFTALLNRKAELAAIYELKLVGKTLYYAPTTQEYGKDIVHSITLDENDEYIIKQLLFWYSANLARTNSSRNIVTTTNVRDNWFFTGMEYKQKSGGGMEWVLNSDMAIIYEDICNAVLHNHQRDDDTLSDVTDTAFDSSTVCYTSRYGDAVVPATANMEFFKHLSMLLASNYGPYINNEDKIEIKLFKPANNGSANQRFVGIHVPPEEQYYGIAVRKKGGSTYEYKDYTLITNNSTTVTAPSVSSLSSGFAGYECKRYMVYRSDVEYTVEEMGTGNKIENFDGNDGSSYTLKKSDAYKYNVIVFEYEKKPITKYNVNIEYYVKAFGDSDPPTPTYKETQTYNVGQDVSIPIKYNDTYNKDLCYKVLKDGVSQSINDVSFSMPSKDVTIKIYYQYGRLTVNRIIRKNDGSTPITVSTETKDLKSDQPVTLDNELKNTVETGDSKTYYYYKYISGSTEKYWNDSGYTKDSTVTIAKQQNNVEVNIYYGLRRYDYAHTIRVEEAADYSYTVVESDSGFVYNDWNSVSPLVSAKNTPWYRKDGNEYLKLEYIEGKYLNDKETQSLESLRNNGTTFSGRDFGYGSMQTANATDSVFVEFYYKKVPSKNVIVRHLVKQNDTYVVNKELTNKYAIVKNNAQEHNGIKVGEMFVVTNGYSQRKSIATNHLTTLDEDEIDTKFADPYNEFYELDLLDTITVDRSGTVLLDGVYYKCIGVRTEEKANNEAPEIKAAGINTSSLRQVITSGSNYVFVDYYYDPEDYSEKVQTPEDELDEKGNPTNTKTDYIGDSARLRYFPNKSESLGTALGENNSIETKTDGAERDNVAYVPVTENLKPYIVTDICRARTIKYEIEKFENEDTIYKAATYTAWAVSNNENEATADVIGLYGNTNTDEDKKQLYSAKARMNIKDRNNLNQIIKNTFNDVINTTNLNGIFKGNISYSDSSVKNILNSIASKETEESYFLNSDTYNVPSNKYNGFRNTRGNVYYEIYTLTSSGIAKEESRTTSKIYNINSMSVNVYTPAEVGDINIKSINFVNHSDVNSSVTGLIQQGVTFSVTVSTKKDSNYPANIYNNIKNTGKYVKYWYLIFDFDVTYGGKTYTSGKAIRVDANTSNKYAETTITGLQAVTNSADKSVVESTLNHVKAIAATINIPDSYDAYGKISQTNTNKKDTNSSDIRIANEYIPRGTTSDMGLEKASYYLVSKLTETISIGRVFDFEITDCLDVNFKDVFRYINSEDNTVNSLTGTRYFSGIRRLLATDSITTNTTNILVNRSNLVVGSVTKTLPLGPYKHTTNAYVNSVKLGYRFSFDLKTSGYYNPGTNNDVTRSVKITPSYYYISKDGTNYMDNIKLYYKNSSGNYTNFEESDYTIYYKPDDGYRNLYNSSTYSDTDVSKTSTSGKTTLTSSLVGLKLGSSSGFTLSSDKSMTISDGGYLQAWYGEFKLPNSTIALAVDGNGNIDINSPLTSGYIGVKFDIECIDEYKTRKVTVSYNSNDTGLGNNATNTTQWDYEGYLGFKESNVGSNLNGTLKLQLENGTWNIDDTMYNKIKGTVILYDLDNRAANDYD